MRPLTPTRNTPGLPVLFPRSSWWWISTWLTWVGVVLTVECSSLFLLLLSFPLYVTLCGQDEHNFRTPTWTMSLPKLMCNVAFPLQRWLPIHKSVDPPGCLLFIIHRSCSLLPTVYLNAPAQQAPRYGRLSLLDACVYFSLLECCQVCI